MRRPLVVLVSGLLLFSAACGTARDGADPTVAPGPGQAAGQPAAPGGAPSAEPTAALCQAVGEVYSTKLGPFASALSEMVAAPAGSDAAEAARGEAQQALGAFAAEVRSVTATTTIAEAREHGAEAADTMAAKAKDAKFFAAIKTGKDVEKILGTTFGEWLEPVDQHCS